MMPEDHTVECIEDVFRDNVRLRRENAELRRNMAAWRDYARSLGARELEWRSNLPPTDAPQGGYTIEQSCECETDERYHGRDGRLRCSLCDRPAA